MVKRSTVNRKIIGSNPIKSILLNKITRFHDENIVQIVYTERRLQHIILKHIFFYNKIKITDYTRCDFIGKKFRFNLILILSNYLKICFFIIETRSIFSLRKRILRRNWLEREIFDCFGLFFSEHPQLQRLLTNYGFKGHPLRKDFPLSGFVELHYFEIYNTFLYEPVVLSQNYRNFYFTETWKKREII